MPPVRIVCISDTHGQHAKLSVPAGDVLIHAGDFMAFGDTPKEIVDFNHWLGRQSQRFKVVIAGNHDLMFERHPLPSRAALGHDVSHFLLSLAFSLSLVLWLVHEKHKSYAHRRSQSSTPPQEPELETRRRGGNGLYFQWYGVQDRLLAEVVNLGTGNDGLGGIE